MGELMEKVLEMLKRNSAGFVVEQCHIVEHACVRTGMGLGDSKRGPKDPVEM
jgi:hypothetical protein